jgi:hypothetical protein
MRDVSEFDPEPAVAKALSKFGPERLACAAHGLVACQ